MKFSDLKELAHRVREYQEQQEQDPNRIDYSNCAIPRTDEQTAESLKDIMLWYHHNKSANGYQK